MSRSLDRDLEVGVAVIAATLMIAGGVIVAGVEAVSRRLRGR